MKVDVGETLKLRCESEIPQIWFYEPHKSEVYKSKLGSSGVMRDGTVQLTHVLQVNEGFYCCVGFSKATQTYFLSEVEVRVYG